MRKVLTITTILVSLLLFAIASSSFAEAARVKGYYKRNGTYVAPHYRTNPNSYKWDNYSSRGNINPYSGRRGYRRW